MSKHDEPNEISELWNEYHEEQKARRLTRLESRTKEIMTLERHGFSVRKLSDYCYRVNDQLDLYPIHNRWHDIKTNKRGGARNLTAFAHQFFKK